MASVNNSMEAKMTLSKETRELLGKGLVDRMTKIDKATKKAKAGRK